MFPHMFTHRLRVWNPELFIDSVRNTAARAIWGPSGSINPQRIPTLGFYLSLYVSKYHVRRDDALLVVFCVLFP